MRISLYLYEEDIPKAQEAVETLFKELEKASKQNQLDALHTCITHKDFPNSTLWVNNDTL